MKGRQNNPRHFKIFQYCNNNFNFVRIQQIVTIRNVFGFMKCKYWCQVSYRFDLNVKTTNNLPLKLLSFVFRKSKIFQIESQRSIYYSNKFWKKTYFLFYSFSSHFSLDFVVFQVVTSFFYLSIHK